MIPAQTNQPPSPLHVWLASWTIYTVPTPYMLLLRKIFLKRLCNTNAHAQTYPVQMLQSHRSSIRQRSHHSPSKEDSRPRQCNASYDVGKGHSSIVGGGSQKLFQPSRPTCSRRRVSWSDDPPAVHFVPSINRGRKPLGLQKSPTRKPRCTTRSSSSSPPSASHGMTDPDYHWFLGGSGDDDDLMGFPGMWNSHHTTSIDRHLQDTDTDDDRSEEDVDASILNSPRDIVVATALLLFGLWRLTS